MQLLHDAKGQDSTQQDRHNKPSCAKIAGFQLFEIITSTVVGLINNTLSETLPGGYVVMT